MENYSKIEELEHAMYALDDAIEAIKELGYLDDVECLKDIRRMYEQERDTLNTAIAIADRRDVDDLTREYYRGLL